MNFCLTVNAHKHLQFNGRLFISLKIYLVVAHMQHCTRIKPPIGKICNYSHMSYSDHIITYITHYSNNVLDDNCFIGIFIVILLILLRTYILKYNGLSFHKGNMTNSTCHRWDSWSCSFKTTHTLIHIQVLIGLTRTSTLNIVHNHF